jgi:hypothetical protein
LKPVFIIAVVFSVAIALVGVVAMTNTADAELFDINRPMSLTQFVQNVSENAAEANKAITEAKRIEVAEVKLAKAKVAADKAEDAADKVVVSKVVNVIEEVLNIDSSKVVVSKAVVSKASTEDRVMIAEAKATADKASDKAAEAKSEYKAALSEYAVVGGKVGADAKRIEVAEAKLAKARVAAEKAEDAAEKASIAVKTAENIASYNTYKADGAAQSPARDYGSSTYNAPQAPTTNYGSSTYNAPQAPTTNYGSAEPYVPPKLDFKPFQIPEPKYQFKEPDRSVITDHKLDIPNFKPNPIPKSMPIPPSINPAKQFVYDNPGRDIVLSRENPGIPNSAWNP